MIFWLLCWVQREREPGWAQADWLGNCSAQDKTWAPWARAAGAEVLPCCWMLACCGGRPARICWWKRPGTRQGTIKHDYEMFHLRRLESMNIIFHYQNLRYVYSYRWLWDFSRYLDLWPFLSQSRYPQSPEKVACRWLRIAIDHSLFSHT